MENNLSLKSRIKEAFPDMPEDHFSNYSSDLLILYSKEVFFWLRDNFMFPDNVKCYRSDVEGQSWYGKMIIEVPFVVPKEERK